MLLYSSLHKTLNLDRARQSQIEALRSERGSSSPYGKSDEEDRFGKVVTGQNSKFYAGWSMCAILLLLPLQALNASDLEKKEENYNIALNDYLSQERENSDQNAPLSLSIAETYYQLGAYPWTILYLKRAIKQGMDKTVLEEPLHRLNERLGLPISKPSDISFIDHLHLPFELSKTCTLFFWSSLAAWVLLSAFIWFKKNFLKISGLSLLCVSLLLLFCLFTVSFLSPIEGIVVKATGLYSSPEENGPQIREQPLQAGSSVTILQTSSQGNFVKVKDSDQLVGFIPTPALRTI